MKGLLLAIGFLTRLPVPAVRAGDADFAGAIRWFPAVGLIVGGIVCAAGWAGGRIDPWLGALMALLAWVSVTGALHLDGLGDIADAAGAAHKAPARLRAVLADPHVGSFGVVAIAVQLAAKLVLLRLVIQGQGWAALLLVPYAARIGPLAWTLALPPLHEGLAARFRGARIVPALLMWGAILAGCAAWLPALLLTPVLLIGWAAWLRRRIGGISGDGHGAGIELVESGLLLATVIMAAISAGAPVTWHA